MEQLELIASNEFKKKESSGDRGIAQEEREEFQAFLNAGYDIFDNDDGEFYITNRFGQEWTEKKLYDLLGNLNNKTIQLTNSQLGALKALRFCHLAREYAGYELYSLDDENPGAFTNNQLIFLYNQLKGLFCIK